jgi:predicted nucleic acid-binding protein
MAIPSCLVDTNILLRMTRRSDPQHQVVDAALARLAGQGTILHYTHQNVAELWNAMTRPVVRNWFWVERRGSRERGPSDRGGHEFLTRQ